MATKSAHLETALVNDNPSMSGKVLDINWRFVNLMGYGDHYLSIPNSVISKMAVVNMSQPNSIKKIRLEVPMHGSIPPAKAEKILLRAAEQSDSVLADPKPSAKLKKFPDNIQVQSSLYSLSYHTDSYKIKKINGSILASVWYQCRRAELPATTYDFPPIVKPAQSELEVFLAKTDLFSTLSSNEITQLALGALCHAYGPPEKVLTQGQTNSSLFIIYSGQADIYLSGNTGPSVKVGSIASGQYFGEMSLLTGEPCGATVKVVNDSILLEITHDNIAALFDENPLLMEKLSKITVERTVQNNAARDSVEQENKDADSMLGRLVSRVREFFGHQKSQ